MLIQRGGLTDMVLVHQVFVPFTRKEKMSTVYFAIYAFEPFFGTGDLLNQQSGPGAGPCALLDKFWRISLYVTDDAIAKPYVT